MLKHTPGPWETSRDAVPAGYTQITVYAESDGERVATVFRDEANARLISAAPDMLAALRAFVRDRATCPTTNGKDLSAWDDMRAAISKAVQS